MSRSSSPAADEPGLAASEQGIFKDSMRFISLTRHNEIGANSYFLEINGRKIILDAGLHPKKFGEEALPNYRRVADGEIDAVFISHAHQDHIGSLPILTRRQPHAQVFLTPATAPRPGHMLPQFGNGASSAAD